MKGLQSILDLNNHYTTNDLDYILSELSEMLIFSGSAKGVKYYNIPCAFDIETTSFFRQSENNEQPEKCATMYIWMFSIYGYCIVGRTWLEFQHLMYSLSDKLKTDNNNRLLIYVHSLAFDFSFFRKWLEWENVFASKSRSPIYALTKTGLEFRCSYMLSGYKLETIAEKHLQKYHVLKMVGDLDYDLIRHSETPLTDKEMKYCLNDYLEDAGYQKINSKNLYDVFVIFFAYCKINNFLS